MLIDTHAHLFNQGFSNQQIDEILSNLSQNNIEKVILASASIEDCFGNVALANKYSNVFCTIGIHPENIGQLNADVLDKLKELSKNPKVVAIGEIGLDYFYEGYDKNKQIDGFIKQVELAHSLKLPIVIHLRDAYEDMLNIIKQHPHLFEYGFDVHCYSGSVEFAKELLKFGAYFSFTGNITFKNAKKAIRVIEFLPTNRIMTETDCPYLAPEPVRGTKNEPKNVRYVVNKISQIKQIESEELCEIIKQNVRDFYRI